MLECDPLHYISTHKQLTYVSNHKFEYVLLLISVD